MASDKYTQKINRNFLEKNMGLFLNATWQQNEQKAQSFKNIAFF